MNSNFNKNDPTSNGYTTILYWTKNFSRMLLLPNSETYSKMINVDPIISQPILHSQPRHSQDIGKYLRWRALEH